LPQRQRCLSRFPDDRIAHFDCEHQSNFGENRIRTDEQEEQLVS
jgi:hypothetical protein